MQLSVRRVLRQRSGSPLQQLLYLIGQLGFFVRRRRRLPAREQRPRRDDVSRRAARWLGVEVPNVSIAMRVLVRIPGKDVGGQIARHVPLARAVVQLQVDRRQIARVIAIARIDDERHGISRLHRDLLQRPDWIYLCAVSDPRRQPLPRVAAPQFERPRDAVAALGMSMLHAPADAERCRRRTPPANRDRQLRSRMDGDAVRLHVARNAHVLIGRVRDHAEGIVADPAFDEVIACATLLLASDRRPQLDRSTRRTDPQIIEPRRERLRFNTMFLREQRGINHAGHRARFRRCAETLRGTRKNAFASNGQFLSHRAHVAQQ